MARSRLKNMKISSVHCVPAGDNPEAHILIRKHREPVEMEPETSEAEIEAAVNKAIEEESTEGGGDVTTVDEPASEATETPAGEGTTETVVMDDPGAPSEAAPTPAPTPEQQQGLLAWFKDTFGLTPKQDAPPTKPAAGDLEGVDKAIPTFDELTERDRLKGFFSEAVRATDNFISSLDYAVYDGAFGDEDPKALIKKNTEQFLSRINALLDKAGSDDVAKIGKEIDAGNIKKTREAIHEAVERLQGANTSEASEASGTVELQKGAEMPIDREKMLKAALEGVTDEEIKEAIRKSIMGEDGGATDTSEPPEPVSEVRKGLSSEEREMFKDVPDSMVVMYKRQQDSIRKLEVEKEEVEYISKAEKLYKNLPVSPQEIGPVMRRLEKGEATADDAKYMQDVLASTNAMAKMGGSIFDEIGRQDGDGALTKGDGSAKAELMHKAQEYVREHPDTNPEVAFAKVGQAEPELYQRYEEEEFGDN